MAQTYSGFNDNTAKHLLLDSGAFYKNYDIATDTPETANAKLLGATRGGGEFVAQPEIRNIEVDGVKGMAKGLQVLDTWTVSLKANMLEMTTDVLKAALATGDVDSVSNTDYDIITAKNNIELSHYIDNITWIGTLSGSNKPVIIQVFNALCKDGLTLTTQDKGETVAELTFSGHYDASDLQTPPFKIFYPKLTSDTTAPTVSVTPTDGASSVSVDSNIVWTFSEAIQPTCVNSANFFVMKASDGSLVPGTLSLNVAKTVVTFDPTSNLDAASAYIAIATTNVKDLAGNALAVNSVTNFTTT